MDPNVQMPAPETNTEISNSQVFSQSPKNTATKTKLYILGGAGVVLIAMAALILGSLGSSVTKTKVIEKNTAQPTSSAQALNGEIYWSVANNTNDPTLQNEIKNAFASFHPGLKDGATLEVYSLHLSAQNPAYGVASMRARDKNNAVISTVGLEYLLTKVTGVWVIIPRGSADFCSNLINMPDDLQASRTAVYTECYNSDGE